MHTGFSSTPRRFGEQLAIAGERATIEALFRRFYPPVHSLCLRMLGREDEAHDCAQETFLRVLRAGVPAEARERLASWLFRIAANLAIDGLRRRGLERATVDADERPGLPPIRDGTDADRVRDAMTRLPPESRAIVVLRLREDWPYREIGESLGISENLARVRFFRALGMLRETLR